MHDGADAGLFATLHAILPGRHPSALNDERQIAHLDDFPILHTHTATPPLKRRGATIAPNTEHDGSAAGFRLHRLLRLRCVISESQVKVEVDDIVGFVATRSRNGDEATTRFAFLFKEMRQSSESLEFARNRF
jgi:hypothetical protein